MSMGHQKGNKMIFIDGSMGEGGGQIIRSSLTLSAITGQSFYIKNIRSKRPVPGLKRQHLTCVNAVAEICDAEVDGAEIKSQKLLFTPGKIKAGDYRFDIGTAGSVCLVAQVVIPILLMAEEKSTVVITGGTHVSFAPTWEFFMETYLPQLRAMGAEVSAEQIRYGFNPAGGGEIRLEILPLRAYKPYSLCDYGKMISCDIKGVYFGVSKDIARDEVAFVERQLREFLLGNDLQEEGNNKQEKHVPNKYTNVVLSTSIEEVEADSFGNYCYAKLVFENVSIVFSEIASYGRSRYNIAKQIIERVKRFINSGAAVEVHLADQLLLLFGALPYIAGYRSDEALARVSIEKKHSLHYDTNLKVVKYFLESMEEKVKCEEEKLFEEVEFSKKKEI